jgi:hypothetical protein
VGQLHIVVGLLFLALGAFILVRRDLLIASGGHARRRRGPSPRVWTAVGILWLVLGLVEIGLGIAA